MKNAFVIHGAFGNPKENWIPWLKAQLESREYAVSVPVFPTPEGQNYDNWMRTVEPYLKDFNEDTILVGHSIGATFTLCVLERLDVQIAKTLLVSGFLGSLENEEFDAVNRTIAERSFDWAAIKQHSKEFCIFHGSDDPYVPLTKAAELGQHLDVVPTVIPNGGHLNEAAGFREFPKALQFFV